MGQVKKELEYMTKLGVIARMDEPTEWCLGMVIVPKYDGQVRICVDSTMFKVIPLACIVFSTASNYSSHSVCVAPYTPFIKHTMPCLSLSISDI